MVCIQMAEPTKDDAGTTSPKRKRGRGADPAETRLTLCGAAITSLLELGYSGTTARSIAARAECNQAAIYYHFGGIDELLIEALRLSSAERLERYTDALPEVSDLGELVTRLQALYEEDSKSGHLGLLTELIGGVTATPELQAGIQRATTPWLEFVEARVAEAAATVPFGALLPTDDLADLIFSLIVGVELRNKIDGSSDRSTRLFELAALAVRLSAVEG